MKAILVVDIRGCDDCPCSGEEFGMCQAVNNEKECDYYNMPSWCPLKPMPQKTYAESPDSYKYGFADGWNACLDEITGESNG